MLYSEQHIFKASNTFSKQFIQGLANKKDNITLVI